MLAACFQNGFLEDPWGGSGVRRGLFHPKIIGYDEIVCPSSLLEKQQQQLNNMLATWF
jgi:hypothetical protein